MASLLGLAKALRDLLPDVNDVEVSDDDRDLAGRVWRAALNMLAGSDDCYDGLDGTEDFEEVGDLEFRPEDESMSSDPDNRRLKFEDWSDEKKLKLLSAYDNAPEGRKLKAVKHLLSANQRDSFTSTDIARLRTGYYRDKANLVREHVKDEFYKARNKRQLVTTLDLQFWARQRARELGMTNFTASKSWLYTLKQYFTWSSRKVTRVVTFKELQSQDDLTDKMMRTVTKIQESIRDNDIRAERVINIDQSGFNYDYAPKRTLSITGERHTEVAVRSKDSTTHSYSIQIAMSAAGKLVGPVHLMLQEPGKSTFGPIVRKQVDAVLATIPAGQIAVDCSSSGKFGAASYGTYISKVMQILGSEYPVLLLKDSWTGQTGSNANSNIFNQYENLHHVTFPPGSTAFLQPEDLVLFHPWKLFWREAIKHVRFMEISIEFRDRLNIIILHALIRNQLSSIVFREMMIYGFTKPGLIEDDQEGSPFFEAAKDVWFPSISRTAVCSHNDVMSPCKSVFILCSHCRLSLCFDHFFGRNSDLYPRHFHV